jgi:Fe-S-cluster-containing hydrogenase component 2
MAKAVVNPEAELPSRPRDMQLTEDLLASLELFSSLKRAPTFAKFPGTCVLRHYQRNEVICRQGEGGGTAFYLLTRADIAALLQRCADKLREEWNQGLREFHDLLQSVSNGKGASAAANQIDPRRLATARLMVDMRRGPTVRSRESRKQKHAVDNARPTFIANDGPADIDYETRQAPMYEGEVFGEMSCLTRQPRSATVIVDSECFVLEFLRNILELMRKDGKYNDEAEKTYRERVLGNHLRQLSIFQLLSTEEFERVKQDVELVRFAPGTLIWDEGDASDALYVVRSGIVQVIQSFPWRLTDASISDWAKLWATLRAIGEMNPVIEHLHKSLPKDVRELLAATEGDPSKDANLALVNGLNEVAKTDVLLTAKESQTTMSDPRITCETGAYSTTVKSWTGLQVRRANRLLFHVLFPQAVLPAEAAGLARVLRYLGRGGVLGEIGVVEEKPRTAACLAYAHPQLDREATDVELVRVPAKAVRRMKAENPRVAAEIEKMIGERKVQDEVSSRASIGKLSQSRRVEELGLLQGQNLMLIDLDRCTRCGDCVQACIDTHDDGHSRLFLDGQRYGKYLIPSSCRKCRDPICMIGCPVGSILQGEDGEIRIREWCIGCGLCANQCPYESIQMHDSAMLPSGAPGWWWTDDSIVEANGNWNQPSYSETKWQVASTPFSWGLAMLLALPPNSATIHASLHGRRLYFRARFQNIQFRRGSADRHRLLIISQGTEIEAHMNGQRLDLIRDAAPKKRFHYVCDLDGDRIRHGENVLAISVITPEEFGATALDARLDALAPASEEVEEKLVTERAVVCDQCSSLSGGRHACVYACPHEAAFRLDAWVNLPNY